MLFFSILIWINFFTINVAGQERDCINQICTLGEEPIAFKTPNYPDAYVNLDPVKILSVRVEPNSNYGYGLQYYRYVTDYRNDYLYFCDVDDFKNCSEAPKYSVTGTVMDDYFPVDYYNQTDVLYLFFSPAKTGLAWPGILGKVTRLDQTVQLYNDCSKEAEIDLDSIGAGFYSLVSDHFSRQYFDHNYDLGAEYNVSCTSRIRTTRSTNIRMVVYSFQSNPPESLNMTGILANETSISTRSLSGMKEIGDFYTYYYKNDLTLSYTFTALNDTDDDPYQDYYYYILISAYNESNTQPFDQCENVGEYDLSQTNWIDFSGQANGASFGYNQNTKCRWVFKNPPPNHQLMLSFYHFVTEKCCDYVYINGSAMDRPYHSGSDVPWLVYGSGDRLEVSFETDSIEQYTYMVGQAAAINCTCPPASTTLKSADSTIISYGWNPKFPFCSPIVCKSTINFPRDSVLEFEVTYAYSFTSNFWLSSGQIVMSDSSGYSSHDSIDINFNNTFVTDLYKLWDNTGYTVYAKTIQITPQIIDLDLCGQDFILIDDNNLKNQLDSIVYRFNVTNCSSTNTRIYFLTNTGYLMDLYEGAVADGKLLVSSDAMGPSVYSPATTSFSLRLIKNKDNKAFKALITANPKISMFLPSDDTACWSEPDSYSGSLTGNKSHIIIVFRGNLPSWADNPETYGISLQNFSNRNYPLEIYQTISFDDKDKIYGGKDQCTGNRQNDILPQFIFGEFVTIRLLDSIQSANSFSFQCQQRDNYNLTSSTMQPILLMAPKYSSPNLTKYRYSYNIAYENTNGYSGVALNFLNPRSHNSNLSVSYVLDGQIKDQREAVQNNTCGLKLNVMSFVLTYEWICNSTDTYQDPACRMPLLLEIEPVMSTIATTPKVATTKSLIGFLWLIICWNVFH